MKIRHTLLVTLTLVAIIALVACGGGEKPPLTMQEYADEMVRFQDEFKEDYEKTVDEVFAKILGLSIGIRAEIYSDEASEESIAAASETFDDNYLEVLEEFRNAAIQQLKNYRDELNDLHPPPDVLSLHEEWILSIDMEISVLEHIDLKKQTGEGFPGLGGDREELENSCKALREALEAELGRLDVCSLFDLGLSGVY